MSLQKSYKLISNALLPDFPVVSEVEKSNIVDAASIFIQKQINLQPYFILVPILVLVFLMAITIQIAGPSFIVFWLHIETKVVYLLNYKTFLLKDNVYLIM